MNYVQMSGGMVNNIFGFAPVGAWSSLEKFFPDEIATSTIQIFQRTKSIEVEGEKKQGSLVLVPANFTDVFQLEVLRGNLQSTLEAPNRVALTEYDALQYFGSIDVLGRQLAVTTDDGVLHDLEVTAVFGRPLRKTAVNFVSFSLLDKAFDAKLEDTLNNWASSTTSYLYVVLEEGADMATINAQMQDYINQYGVLSGYPAGVDTSAIKLGNILKLQLQRLREIHFNPVASDQRGDPLKVKIFASIAVLILLIGTVNYVTLATAQSMDRKREIGVKKTAGATGAELMLQFIGESLVYTTIALLLAVGIAALVLPTFSTLTSSQLHLDFTSWQTMAYLLLITLVVGVAGGFYPGLVLSRFRPEKVLRSADDKVSSGTSSMRSLLMSFQFTIAIGMILATLVLYVQLEFIREHDTGFNATNIAIVSMNISFQSEERQSQFNAFRNALGSLAGVEELTIASRGVNEIEVARENRNPYTRTQGDSEEVPMISLTIDHNFMHVYQIPVLAGRDFDAELDPIPRPDQLPKDAEGWATFRQKVLLNLMATKALGFASAQDAAGATIYAKNIQGDGVTRYAPKEIVGVVADNQFLSLRDPPTPMLYFLPQGLFYYGSFQTRLTRGYEETFTTEAEKLWQDIVGEDRTRIAFAETRLAGAFDRERNEGKLMMFFAALAIMVSCLGLYGIVMFELRRRTKEIGIRKALGDDVRGLVTLFLKQFTRPILFANLVAWPLAVWGMLQWLQRFPYQMDKFWLFPLCLVAAFIVLILAMLTVAIMTARAAAAKPVQSLRYE